MLPNMAKKPSKRRTPARAVIEPHEAAPRCPYCGTTNSERSALSLMDQLFRSHTELCAALRLAGRQMLRLEQQGDGSLERIRKALKRADNVRKMLEIPDESRAAIKNLKNIDEIVVEAPPSAAECSPDQGIENSPMRKNVQKRTRLTRPNSLRVVRFPTG